MTFLVEANACLDEHPVLKRAQAHWQAGHQPGVCIGCKTDTAMPAVGAYLFATSPAVTNARPRRCFVTIAGRRCPRARSR